MHHIRITVIKSASAELESELDAEVKAVEFELSTETAVESRQKVAGLLAVVGIGFIVVVGLVFLAVESLAGLWGL